MSSQVFLSDDLTCGFVSEVRLDDTPPCLVVRSLDYDSSFRSAGLRAGDQILELDGVSPSVPPGGKTGSWTPTLPGQYQESDRWRSLNRQEGDPLSLTIRRKSYPHGWQTLHIKGTLRRRRTFRTEDNQQTIFENGPGNYTHDGFSENWPTWFESISQQISTVACFGPLRPGLTTKYEYQRLLEHKPRVEFLQQQYPGAFADATAADFQTALETLHGTLVPLSPADLAYRTEDEVRVQKIAEIGKASWQGILAARADETVPAFPAQHPIQGKLKEVAGRCVLLPDLTKDKWISEAGHGYFAAGSDSDGWYFLDMESPAAQRMLMALRRYQRRVSDHLDERYTLLVRILPDPRILVIDEIGHWGLQVELLAASIGDACFIDLQGPDPQPPFVGEADLMVSHGDSPPDDAPPEVVLKTMIQSIKSDDLPLWKSLFADWLIRKNPDGTPQVCFLMQEPQEEDFGRSRTSFTGRLYDARVLWTDDARAVTTGAEYAGAPHVEEVVAEIDHIGLINGEYRSFMDVTVNRFWNLQRLNGGPWRIASLQPI